MRHHGRPVLIPRPSQRLWFVTVPSAEMKTIAFAESAGAILPSQVTFNLLEMYFAHRQHREGKKATTVNRTRYALGSFSIAAFVRGG
jgi:hypothetical protein